MEIVIKNFRCSEHGQITPRPTCPECHPQEAEITWKGDTPCADCKTTDNPVWFTDNVFWNDVMDEIDDRGRILCVNCFIVRAEEKYRVKSWRILPEFIWTKK